MLTLKKHELKSRDVFEIMQGRLNREHWLESSLFITEDCWGQTELSDILTNTLVHFNYYGPTEISRPDWERVKSVANSSGSGLTKQLVAEIDEWADDCFSRESCFTICGI